MLSADSVTALRGGEVELTAGRGELGHRWTAGAVGGKGVDQGVEKGKITRVRETL